MSVRLATGIPIMILRGDPFTIDENTPGQVIEVPYADQLLLRNWLENRIADNVKGFIRTASRQG